MPAVVNKTVGSFVGMSEELGISLWFFDLKKSMYSLISCCLVVIFFMLELGLRCLKNCLL